jgi:UDP-N-acetylglucosamine acyltransferase
MNQIHPTAVIDAAAELGAGVRIGPYCHVGPEVCLGDDCELLGHVTLLGPAEYGRGNIFYPGAVLGAAPQDLKYRGSPTRLIVGAGNTFREYVTVHRGTEIDRLSEGATRIGNQNLLMVGVHVAHDVLIGNHVILANAALLAGHVCIEDCVNVGGGSAMHHFVTVGRNAFIGGMTRITHDVPPYMKVVGYDQAVRGVNTKGLERWRFPPDSIRAIRLAHKLLYARQGERSPGRTAAVLAEIESNGLGADPHVRYLVDFLRRKMDIGVFGRMREHARSDRASDIREFYDSQDD